MDLKYPKVIDSRLGQLRALRLRLMHKHAPSPEPYGRLGLFFWPRFAHGDGMGLQQAGPQAQVGPKLMLRPRFTMVYLGCRAFELRNAYLVAIYIYIYYISPWFRMEIQSVEGISWKIRSSSNSRVLCSES